MTVIPKLNIFSKHKTRILLCTAFLLAHSYAFSQIKLPKLISDGMVLQRETPVKVWGWASAGEKVKLSFKGKAYNAVTGQDGKWTVQLPAQPAGGPYEITLAASNNITLKDVLFGDVWICSGQSNMELPMSRVKDKYADVIAQANNPQIRHFEVPDRFNFQGPKEDIESGSWQSVTPKNVLSFSAVAYFFAKDLYAKYKVPIGLINSALGGSPAESWMSEEALKKFPTAYAELEKFKDPNTISQIEAKDKKTASDWYALVNQIDEGLKGHWRSPSTNASSWKTMNIPGFWADGDLGNVNGVVWFRREIDVPKAMTGQAARLDMGRIVDADSVFVNGTFVGTTSYQYPPRIYTVPANLLKEGKNVITVRVINSGGRGGFVPEKPYALTVGTQKLPLTGAWQYKLGATMKPLPGETVIRWKPAGLFNSMIAPLTVNPIKGVLWYQGESNTGNPSEYESLMKTLIPDWRSQWKQGNFPFILVQLANFMETKSTPTESNWAATRQAQLNTLSLPNTGLAVIIDAGEWNDIHPLNKQDVGKRLALQARKLAYGDKTVVASGPMLQSVKAQGNKLVLTFTSTGSGLVAKGNKPLTYFAVAGSDKKYSWAKAEIKGNQVTVWSEDVKNPVSVRYAWADNPEGANLYNKEDLPASPFEASVK